MTATPDSLPGVEQLDARRRRFNDILDGYECGAGDWTMPTLPVGRDTAMRALPAARVPVDDPDAARYTPGRYALVCDSLRGHGYHVTNASDLATVEADAVANITGGWQPVCYFDLDRLAGPEPLACEGDVVEHAGQRWHVIRTKDDHADGVLFQWLHLDQDPDVDWLDGAAQRVDESECVVVEPAEPDTRMPVRYTVARLTTTVVFNTIPTPA